MAEVFDYEANNPLNNEAEDECSFCGAMCDGEFCSDDCKQAEYADNRMG